jgi:hypothetical protein
MHGMPQSPTPPASWGGTVEIPFGAGMHSPTVCEQRKPSALIQFDLAG